MSTATLVLGIVLIVFAVFLVVAVLMQQGKAHNLSGTIAGGAETFFGKSKGQTLNKKLNILTTIVAIIFVLIVLGFYVTQTTSDYSSIGDFIKGVKTTETTETADDEEAATEDTATEEDAVVDDTVAEDTTSEDAVVEDTIVEDTVVEDTVAEDTVVEDTVAEN